MSLAAQSCPLDQLLDGVETLCAFGSQLDPTKVVEWFSEERPKVEGQQVVSVRLGNFIPDVYAGAGREGMLTDIEIIVTLWTKMSVDKVATDKYRIRSKLRNGVVIPGKYGVGHLPRLWGIIDYLDGEHVYPEYQPSTQEPIGEALTWEPLQQMPGPFVVRGDGEDESWIKTPLVFRARIAKALTVPG